MPIGKWTVSVTEESEADRSVKNPIPFHLTLQNGTVEIQNFSSASLVQPVNSDWISEQLSQELDLFNLPRDLLIRSQKLPPVPRGLLIRHQLKDTHSTKIVALRDPFGKVVGSSVLSQQSSIPITHQDAVPESLLTVAPEMQAGWQPEEPELLDIEYSAQQQPAAKVAQVETSSLAAHAESSDAPKQQPQKKRGGWAHAIAEGKIQADWNRVVPELARHFPFELDVFQNQAIYHLEKGDYVFVAAHTSAGKTVVAEYAIALAAKHMTKTIYTSPIKALSNQKFRDFCQTFGEKNVGILTGDVQIRPEASCLIMTTEILRSMLYRGSDVIRDVEFVIFDEVHYVNDADRGHVWEEVIILLPSSINLILLSATVPNCLEFADWVGRTKQREIFVVSTSKRPVPLEHFLYLGESRRRQSNGNDGELIKVVDAEKQFNAKAYKLAVEEKRDKQSEGNAVGKQLWLHLMGHLQKRSLLPVVIFCFSKKRCDEYAGMLCDSRDFLQSTSERSAIHSFLGKALARLSADDAKLPQIERVKNLLLRGIAVHHSGILPILKEAVEMLFQRSLVRVLFATETFAMGVNMPAKTVVFSSTRKPDGNSTIGLQMRDLLPGEYTQMSGRAGRRGLDAYGTVILCCSDRIPLDSSLRHLVLGEPTKLSSQFRVTYSMIVNLLRAEAIKIEKMLASSFSENSFHRDSSQARDTLTASELALKQAPTLNCDQCSPSIADFYAVNCQLLAISASLHRRLLDSCNRIFSPGSILVVNNELLRNVPAVYLRNVVIEGVRRIECVPLYCASESKAHSQEAVPIYQWQAPPISGASGKDKSPKIAMIEAEHVTFISKESIPLKQSILDPFSPSNLSKIFINGCVAFHQRSLQFTPENPTAPLRSVDYASFVKDLDSVSQVHERNLLIQQYWKFPCLKCPQLGLHYAAYHIQSYLREHVAQAQLQLATDQSLKFAPEYQQRVSLMKHLGLLEAETDVVLVKGRVSCEFNTVDELLTTELILENSFAEYDAAEVISLLSCMVFQEKTDLDKSKPEVYAFFPSKLRAGRELITQVATRLALLEVDYGIGGSSVESSLDRLHWGMVPVVYEWAKGRSFRQIAEMTTIAEGSIVRCIVRLDETAREMRSAARIIGDSSLLRKMEEASAAIKRDICFASSLYL